MYDLFGAGYRGFAGSGLGYAVSDGFCPLEALPNKVVFAASAGDIILFDIVRAMQSPPLTARGMTVFSPSRPDTRDCRQLFTPVCPTVAPSRARP